MKKWALFWIIIGFIGVTVIGVFIVEPEITTMPRRVDVINNETSPIGVGTSYDLWGETIREEELTSNGLGALGMHALSPENGAVMVDEAFIDLGRDVFYKETFENEEFLTDILGILDGPITITNVAKAILELRGGHTDNLRVELAEDITIGDRTYKKGEKVDTGLDVPKGALTPLGMPVKFSEGRLKAGVTCAACHATVDRDTGRVIEGAPNLNFNGGLLLAMASNSAAYFTNTDVDMDKLKEYITENSKTMIASNGEEVKLPDPEMLEAAVDEMLIKWPAGNFDSTMDLVNNPAQIPDSFTLGDHPYGWNGFAGIGPFNGLSVLNNNVHAQNSDILAQAEQSDELFDIDKELFIGTILQNAANENYRYKPQEGVGASHFMSMIDDNPDVPGVNEMVKPPTFPKVSMFSPNGTVINSPGFRFAEQINAMSAYQNSLVPPTYEIDEETRAAGREVYNRAGCISCHAGAGYTNHQVISQKDIKTEPSRAEAFQDLPKLLEEPYIYSFDTTVPIREGAKVIRIPTDHIDEEQKQLIFAQDPDKAGGYKTKGLIGLAWSAPYLHDGGVAVGPNIETDLGIPNTLDKAINPDPYNSLRALLDKDLRQKVIAANEQAPHLKEVHVQGIGHEYWVDETTGFTQEEQDALIEYLLSLTRVEEE
ncbi:electron transport protein [Bacillus sp. FJAT-45350]|uniref:electron transport protein n=1 Tax=Bacillus sp. FJAT-45350 TaxID=2011014 RepID=UPI000BB6F66B|nr:electron transport protein [Bacillus sp. FJAT-45350]